MLAPSLLAAALVSSQLVLTPSPELQRALLVAQAEKESAPPDASLGFDLFGDTEQKKKEAEDPAKAHEAEVRRSMLQTHQILGLTTLGVMAASVVLGQLDYSDLYGGGGGRTGNFLWPHRIGTYTTSGLFLATAGYSLFAPVPYAKKGGFDTALVHKIAVIGASAGMLTQVVLGFVTARKADAGNPSDLKKMAGIHEGVGYATLGFMAVAAGVWVF